MSSMPSRTLSRSEISLLVTVRPQLRDKLIAVEHIKKMSGGSQPYLLRSSDEKCYVVKFPNNLQGRRTLVNELVATRLAALLNVPVPVGKIIEVSPELIESSEMFIELQRGKILCEAGPCYGSQYPDAYMGFIFSSMPKQQLDDVANISAFAAMLVFDVWISNTDFREGYFYKEKADSPYQVGFFDHGHSFNGHKWQLVDKPRLALSPIYHYYHHIQAIDAFEPSLSYLETKVNQKMILEAADVESIPPEWYESKADRSILHQLLEQLDTRRRKVRQLVWSLQRSSSSHFPYWTRGIACRSASVGSS